MGIRRPSVGVRKIVKRSYGHAVGAMAKGYKLHAVFGPSFTVMAWRIAPMNCDERVMARRLLRDAPIHGEMLADGNDDVSVL